MTNISDSNEARAFKLDELRADVASGKRPLRITSHAQMEAFKDGLLLMDLRYTFENGEVIEVYPDDNRALLYADLPQYNLPVHIVVKDTPKEGIIVTAYIPDRGRWIANKRRRKRRGKR